HIEISAPAPAYRFTGREHDEPLYLYYYRARYYHTDLQRFISEDPIGFRGGDANLYAYVRNNPIALIDPTGLLWFYWHGAISAAAAYSCHRHRGRGWCLDQSSRRRLRPVLHKSVGRAARWFRSLP